MILSHRRARQLIHRYFDDGLDETQGADLEAHLVACPTCTAYRERVASLEAGLHHSLSQRQPDLSFSRGELRERLSDLQLPIQRQRMKRRYATFLRQATVGAVIVLLAAGMIWAIRDLAPRPASPAPAPTQSDSAPIAAVTVSPEWTAVLPTQTPAPTVDPRAASLPYQLAAESLRWDPSGRWLAVTDSDGKAWLRQRDASQAMAISGITTASPANLMTAWSPTGERLLVYGTWGFDYPLSTGLWIVPVDEHGPGQAQAVLQPDLTSFVQPHHQDAIRAADWSPDGQAVAFVYQGEAWVYRLGQAEPVRVTHLATEPLQRSQGSEPFDGVSEVAFSPDGQQLAVGLSCNCPSPWSGVGVVDLSSETVHLLVDGGRQVAWQADGQRITFQNASGDWSAGNTFDSYAVDLQSGQVTNLTHSNPGYDPLLAPDSGFTEARYQTGSLLAGADGQFLYPLSVYAGREPGFPALGFIVRSKAALLVREFQPNEHAWYVFPGWLADGRYAYLEAAPSYPAAGSQTLFRLRRAVVGEQPVADLDQAASAAAWAPDGSALALIVQSETGKLPDQVMVITLKK